MGRVKKEKEEKKEAPPIKTLFFIGSGGTIGRDIMPALRNFNFNIVTYDKVDGQDTRDINTLRAAMPEEVDYILHLANIPHPGWDDWKEYYSNNVEGAMNILRVAGEKKAKRLIFFSSLAAIGYDAPFGNPPGAFFHVADKVVAEKLLHDYPVGFPPWDEDTPPLPIPNEGEEPVEVYGVSKAWQEKLILDSGIDSMILRLGPYCFDDACYATADVNSYVDSISRAPTFDALGKVFSRFVPGEIIHVCRPGMWGGQKLKDWLDGK